MLARRLARAHALVRQGHEPLKQIADRCGFSDQAHLTRAFKARFGDGLYSGFVGSPAQVSDYLNSLREFGIDRIQLTEMLKGSTLRLSGFWGA